MEEKAIEKGERVKVGIGGQKMWKSDIVELGLKAGDTILCIDPDSEMQRNGESEMLWTVREETLTRIARNGIRTERTSHDYLRVDGLWSHSDDEVI